MSHPSATSPALTMTATDWLLLLILSALWGATFYFAKIAVLEIPPLTLVFGRVAIAAYVLSLITLAIGGKFPRDWRTWRLLAVMAAFNNVVPFMLFFWGQIHISIGLASILNATSPLFGVLIAHAMTHDDREAVDRPAGRADRGLSHRRRGADPARTCSARSAPMCWRSSSMSRRRRLVRARRRGVAPRADAVAAVGGDRVSSPCRRH